MRVYLLILFIAIKSSLWAQQRIIISHEEEHVHSHDCEHAHGKEELSLGLFPSYTSTEQSWNPGIYLHYIRYSYSNSKFGLGFGYEHIFDERVQNFFGLVGAYRPLEQITLSLSPGILFQTGSQEKTFATLCEASYEFKLDKLHIGPMIEYGTDLKSYHISLGLHLAYAY